MSALKPDVDSTHDLGTTALRWRKLWVDEIAATDAIAIGGNLTVTGNLQVDGATTTINSTTLTVDDKNIVVASGAAAAANWTGSGITVDGANATLLYTDDGATTQWEFSDDLELTGKLLPVANATHDLGSSSLGWNDLYLGDGGILQLGDDQDVTLTHIADTGVRLNDAMKLEFRDATEFLHSDANGSMTLEGGALIKLSVNTETVLSADANSVDVAQQLNVDITTASTSSTTGALVVDGGMGLAGDAHFGGDLSLQHDAAVLHLGADDDVSLTHVADTGLLLNSSRQLQFGDSATYVHQSADGQLDAVADVELALTAPVVDIDASTAVRISNDLELDSDAAVLKFGADSDVSLTHVADTGLLLNAGMALQFRDADLSLSSSADGQLDIDADTKVQLTTATAELVVTALDVNASGAITLDGSSASNITVDSANLSLGTTTSGELDLTSAGLLDINGGAGVDIDATGALSLDGSTGINIGVAADVAIDVDSAAFDLDASGAITIDGTSTISIGGAAAAGDISVGTNATARNITVGNVTGATALNLDAGSGGINLGNAADAPINIDASTFDMTSTDTTGFGMSANSADDKTLTVSATNAGDGEGRISVSAADQLDLTDGTATLTLDGGAVSLDTSSTVQINSSAAAISIGNDDVDQNINIGTDGERTIVLGTDSGSGAAPTTKVDVNASTIELDAASKVLLDAAGTGADAIDINSAGGLDVDVADVLSLTTTSGDGHIELISAHTAGVALHIDADANAGSIVDIDAGILQVNSTGVGHVISGGALTLTGGAASTWSTSAGSLTIDGASGVSIAGGAAEVDITTTGALDLNAAATTLDCSTLAIESTDTTSLVMSANDGAEKVLTINASNAGAGAAKIVIGGTQDTNIELGNSTSSTVTVKDDLIVSGNLTVQGTQTVVDTVTMNAQNAVVFEGATADANETTLSIIDPTADHTIYLPNQGGYLPVLSAASTTQITATPEELNYVDVTAGTAAASKALVLDGSKNIATIGTIGCGAITSTGNSGFAQITTSGRVIVDDTTNATSVTDGSLQTDGGLSVSLDAVIGDDLYLMSDAAVVHFGADSDVSLTHVADTGLLLNGSSQLQFRDSTEFIHSDADGFMHIEGATGVNLAVNGTDELAITGTTATFGTNILVPDNATIGSASDTDALQINASGDISLTSTTGSTSPTTGALKVAGGLGVAGALNVAGATELDGTLKVVLQDFVVANAAGSVERFKVAGGSGNTEIAGTLEVDGNCTLGNASSDLHTVNGGLTITGVSTTSNVTSGGARDMDGSEYVYLVTSDNVTVTLPDIGGAEAAAGQRFIIKRTAAHSSGVTVDRAGTDLIDGGTSVVLGAPSNGVKSFIEVISDGTNYHIITSGGSVTVS